MKLYSQEQLEAFGLSGLLPEHVAIIMDGNGRWAKQRGLPRPLGHRAGMERLKGIIRLTSELGIRALSLYAFSTENWRRPKEEIGALFGLLVEYFTSELNELHKNEVCIRVLGDIAPFPEIVREAINCAIAKTISNKGLKLNIALNYGGQNELLRTTRALLQEIIKNDLIQEEINLEQLEAKLDTVGLPAVDLLIRTGGEQRLSNFLLYQSAYAELMFLEEFWPDFSNECYLNALRAYQKRTRRYGGL
ncbi:MAG TPA: polyprenyl diphosphate synthase [Clostridia bacterium]|nr:polyprenyl diphosphate synthase [Clostridia bacterium]